MDGAACLIGWPHIVEHRAHFSVHRADDEEIADVQRAVLHQHRRHRTAALVHARFEHGAAGRRVRIGLQLAQIADEQNHFEQARQILFRLRRDFHHHRVAAPLFGHQPAVGELPLHAFGLGVRLIDLVDRDDDRHIRGLRVRNRLFGLRHHAIVGAHHEHDDVRNLRAARTHARERFVARRIDEDDAASVDVRFVRADVLRDSAGFAGGHFGFADRVEQAGLAVVDVAHHGDDRRARLLIAGPRFLDLFFLNDLFFEGDYLHDSVERFGETRRGRHVERLIDAGENAAVEQSLQQFLRANVELFGQLANRDSFGDRDFARLALHRRDRLGLRRPSSACTRAGAHRMEFALTFGISLFDERTAARRGRFARVKRLAGFSLRNSCSAGRAGTLAADRSLIGPAASFAGAAGTLRISSWRSASGTQWHTGTRAAGTFGQARLRDENSEARRDEAVHQMAVRRDELEIFGLAKEERRRVAVCPNLFPNLFLKPTQDFPMAQQQQDVVPAGAPGWPGAAGRSGTPGRGADGANSRSCRSRRSSRRRSYSGFRSSRCLTADAMMHGWMSARR